MPRNASASSPRSGVTSIPPLSGCGRTPGPSAVFGGLCAGTDIKTETVSVDVLETAEAGDRHRVGYDT